MKSNRFWVEAKDKKGVETIVCHGKDEETGELWHYHMSRASANKLLKAEKKVSPEYKYRVVREVRQMFQTEWE